MKKQAVRSCIALMFAGQSYTLDCRANFPFELDLAAEMRWYISFDGNSDDGTPPPIENLE